MDSRLRQGAGADDDSRIAYMNGREGWGKDGG